MENFNSNTVGEKKKSFSELADEFRPYWTTFFTYVEEKIPIFKTKLCYNAKELPLTEDGEKQQAIRFFESELNEKKDVYIELVDWNNNFYNPMYRKLYKMKYDPEWLMKPEEFIRSSNKTHPTYTVSINNLELVNETSITSSAPVIDTRKPEPVEEEVILEEESYDSSEDDHYSKMTIRDLYCIIQNKPKSNKDWLNNLIKSK